MPDNIEGGSQEFAAFVKNTRSAEELTSGKFITVRGSVHRSGDSTFVLALEGQLLELESSAVERFKVVGTGLHPEVELSINADALRGAKIIAPKPVFLDGPNTVFSADQKQIIKDIHTDPIVDQTLFVLDHKLIHKDPLTDPVKGPFDPVNTGPESTIEGIGGVGVPDPVGQQAAAGMTPFVMATPHHAPSAMVNLQMAAAQGRGAPQFKLPQADTIKEAAFDTFKETIADSIKEPITDTIKETTADTGKEPTTDTIKETTADTGKEPITDTVKEATTDTVKETIADTHKEVVLDTLKETIADTVKETIADTVKETIADTRKEIIETLVEGGGSIQENGGFPGGFPGGFGL